MLVRAKIMIFCHALIAKLSVYYRVFYVYVLLSKTVFFIFNSKGVCFKKALVFNQACVASTLVCIYCLVYYEFVSAFFVLVSWYVFKVSLYNVRFISGEIFYSIYNTYKMGKMESTSNTITTKQ